MHMLNNLSIERNVGKVFSNNVHRQAEYIFSLRIRQYLYERCMLSVIFNGRCLAFILYIQRYAVTETDVKFNGNEKLINIRAV